MKNKVVINTGGYRFELSNTAKTVYDALAKQQGLPPHNWKADPEGWHLDRHDPVLVEVVVLLGRSAHRFAASRADLQVVEIPGNQYYILNYDGDETVLTPEGDHWTVIE